MTLKKGPQFDSYYYASYMDSSLSLDQLESTKG